MMIYFWINSLSIWLEVIHGIFSHSYLYATITAASIMHLASRLMIKIETHYARQLEKNYTRNNGLVLENMQI